MARPSFLRQLKHTCDIERFTPSGVNDYNKPAGVWGNVAANVACLFQQKRGLVTTGRRDTLIDSTVLFRDVMFVPHGTDVREGDQVKNAKYKGTTTNVRQDSAGGAMTFTVLEVVDAAGQKHHLEVKLKAVGT